VPSPGTPTPVIVVSSGGGAAEGTPSCSKPPGWFWPIFFLLFRPIKERLRIFAVRLFGFEPFCQGC
jgi:hypothetical protein